MTSWDFPEAYRIGLLIFKKRTRYEGNNLNSEQGGCMRPWLRYVSPNSLYRSSTPRCDTTPSSFRKSARFTTGTIGHRST